MACCAVAAYIVWRLVSLHDHLERLFSPRTKGPDNVGDLLLSCSPASHSASGFIDQYRPDPDVEELGCGPEAKLQISSNRDSTCVLSLKGITCGACVAQIETTLNDIPGVTSCQVSLALSRAIIEYNSDLVKPLSMISMIQGTGYDAWEYPPSQGHRNLVETLNTVAVSESAWKETSKQLRSNFGITMSLSATIYAVSVAGTYARRPIHIHLCNGAEVIAAVFCLYVSRSMHKQAYKSFLGGVPRTVSTLASVGTIMAFIHSLTLLALPMKNSDDWGQSGDYKPTGSLASMAMLCTVVLGGQVVKHTVSRRSFCHSSRLVTLFPSTATLQSEGAQDSRDDPGYMVATSVLQPGDIIRVAKGECVPADGVVLTGKGSVNQSWLTGDNNIVQSSPGDRAFAGCLLVDGEVAVRVESCGLDTRLGQLIERVSAAQSEPTNTSSNGMNSSRFVDLILMIVMVYSTFLLLAGLDVRHCLERAVSMLLCACPCAIELSVPVSLVSVAAAMAKFNIQFPTRLNVVEDAAVAKTVLFDKTGTLTVGQLELVWYHIALKIDPMSFCPADPWSIILAIERHAGDHPLTRAIVCAAEAQCDKAAILPSVTNARYEPGRGVQGWLSLQNGHLFHVAVGSRRWMENLGIEVDCSLVPQEWRSAIGTSVCIAFNKEQIGMMVLRDKIRPSAYTLISGLLNQGLEVGIITGDSWAAARTVAQVLRIPIGNVHAELLPLDKARIVKEAKRHGPVIVVGDNYNDIAAFSEASVGVYVGCDDHGTHGADAVLHAIPGADKHDMDLARLLQVIKNARAILRRVQLNKFISFSYNIMALFLASGLLQQFDQRLVLTPVMASIGMCLNSFIVVWNGSRIALNEVLSG